MSIKGEILALGGLVGSGRTEVARLAFGVDQPQEGHFEMNGQQADVGSETAAIKAGIALVSEERRSQGLMPDQSVGFNINVASLSNSARHAGLSVFVVRQDARPRRKTGEATEHQDAWHRQQDPGLSGGNQQKAMIARWLGPDIRLLILDEPSRGVDIGAREEIHDVIRELAAKGVGIIVISSDVEELAILADRVVVLHEGKVAGELDRQRHNEKRGSSRSAILRDRKWKGRRRDKLARRRSRQAVQPIIRAIGGGSALTFISRYGTIIGLLAMIVFFSINAPRHVLLDRQLR